jgi:hypothetical protein
MPPIIPQIIGLLAVVTFLASYQQKRRRGIILLNTVSRCLYILQYILLGAFAGAALDVLGAVASVVAAKSGTGFFRRHRLFVILLLDTAMVAAGLLLYEDIYSLLPVAGVLLHTGAFWLTDEKKIRRVSLAGSPFWFVYNLHSQAYFSAVGDILTMISILVAMLRYRKGTADAPEAKTCE